MGAKQRTREQGKTDMTQRKKENASRVEASALGEGGCGHANDAGVWRKPGKKEEEEEEDVEVPILRGARTEVACSPGVGLRRERTGQG